MSLEIHLDKTAPLEPGAQLNGTVRWSVDKGFDALELHLLWFTSGKGTQDVGVSATETITRPAQSGEQSFTFTLPDFPWSFSGTLVTLQWAVEALLEPKGESRREVFVLAPGGQEVRLV